MPYIVKRCATFLVPSGSSKDEDALHLHVVATSPCENGWCLLLTTSTIREGVWHDDTRVFDAGAHEFLKDPSFVNYRFAVVKRCDSISKLVDGWVYRIKPDFPDEMTEHALSGVWESEMTPRYVLDYLGGLGA